MTTVMLAFRRMKRIQRPDIKTPKNNKGNAAILIKSKDKTACKYLDYGYMLDN